MRNSFVCRQNVQMAAGTNASSLSLEDAVTEKYCAGLEENAEALPCHKAIKESAVAFRPGVYPVQRRTSLVLDHCAITHVEGGEELLRLCPKAEELHLAANAISQWKDVNILLSTFPSLSFLDLTKNPLDSTTFTSSPLSSSPSLTPTLHTLVLNSTKIEWDALQVCLRMLHGLQELHLSNNGYSFVNLDPDFKHTALKRLHINDNSLSDWKDFKKLSPAFPNLQALVATSNPLTEISPIDTCSALFPELKSLNLNSSSLEKWESIENLAGLAKLTDISLLKMPLGAELQEKERRFAVIARLPNLKKLNKSEITETEREDAERWLIRTHEHDPNPPAVYSSLHQKHGTLDPLVDIDLSPQLKATVEFCFDDRRSELHCIHLQQTTLQLKRWLSKYIGVPPSSFRLLYVEAGQKLGENGVNFGGEFMNYGSTCLYRYKIKDGGRIYVQMKATKKQS